MTIYKIIADQQPETCLLCPLVLKRKGLCGELVKKEKNGWVEQFFAPDDRCIIEAVGSSSEN